MTQPDDATLSDTPLKAHGDALQDVVDATPDPSPEGADQADDDEQA